LVFNGFDWFKLLFEPIRLELDKFSAQMVDSRPESLLFWKLAHGLLGWGTTLRELKVPSGIAPSKKKIKPPNGSVEYMGMVLACAQFSLEPQYWKTYLYWEQVKFSMCRKATYPKL